jgi:hypothetical protein
MGNLKGVDIAKGILGPNTIGPKTSPSALLATGVAVSGKLVLGTVYTVTGVKDAEDNLGITAAYDTANNTVLHRHIVDFYSYEKTQNVELRIMVVATSLLPADLLEDTGAIYAKKLIIAGAGKIKQLGLAFNLPAGYTETLTDGLNADIRAAIAKAQGLYDWARSTERPCNIILEGRACSSTLGNLIDLHAIPSGAAILAAHKVSICIAQDWDYAEARTNAFCKKYAGVGKHLGVIAACEVNQSGGEVSSFDLSSATKGTWLTAGLSNHLKVDDQEAYLVPLNAKGYIFAGTYTGVSGLRFSGDDTCTPIVIDEEENMSEHTIYYGRTMDYAEVLLKTHLTPLIRSRVSVNTATGKLPIPVVRDIEAGCDEAVFAKMANDGLISGGKTTVDQDSEVLPPANTLNIEFAVVPMAILGKINGTIYLKRKF